MLTDRQKEALDIYKECGENATKAAEKMGMRRQSLQSILNSAYVKLAKAGITENMDVSEHVGQGYAVKGVSTLVGDDGKAKLRWVKTDADKQAQFEAMQEAVKAACEEVPRLPALDAPVNCVEELCNLYVITDYHLGMLAWGEETGDDWDTQKAENSLVKWFELAISQSPTTKSAVFAQLGDFLHWDGFDAVTPSSGHLLDADTRFHRLVRVAIRVIRRIIDMLLHKHEQIHIVMAEGNHDMAASIWLTELFSTLYENEPRITIDNNPDPYYCYEHGTTSLFFHHGHKRKVKNISDVFVAKYREVFGRTKNSYAHLGHLHHDLREENNLMIVEQHRTLAAPDAYASRGGWMSGRDSKVITYHVEHGEVGRVTIGWKMVGS